MMVALRLSVLAVAAACALGANAAQAEVKPETVRPAPAPKLSLVPAKPLNLSAPGLPVLYSRAPTPLPPGIARTSVERKIPGDGVVSSGVLCGLQPSADDSGAARAYGYDPEGKFVGAKLAFSF